jgi:2-oxoglutarate dehydrogenase E1 component
MQVCNLTTPAQIFHALRRQIKREFRIPMIVMSPKSLLRHPQAVSSLDELTKGGFQEVIADTTVDMAKAKKCIFVSGKLYYELADYREKNKIKDVALIRIEQLYPFPQTQLKTILKNVKKMDSVIWAQEEPKNMGAWSYIVHPLQDLFNEMDIECDVEYVGREHRASPATGTTKRHNSEQQKIWNDCFKK